MWVLHEDDLMSEQKFLPLSRRTSKSIIWSALTGTNYCSVYLKIRVRTGHMSRKVNRAELPNVV